MAEFKTNVMRILDKSKIKYTAHSYPCGDTAPSGSEVAAFLGKNPDEVYKTLVTRGNSKQYYVFVIPVEAHLNLKKAAKSVGEKSVEMIKQSELLPLTGYVHGGCSPVGMKKKYPTFLDETCILWEEIAVSAGARGHQMILPPEKLAELVSAKLVDLTE